MEGLCFEIPKKAVITKEGRILSNVVIHCVSHVYSVSEILEMEHTIRMALDVLNVECPSGMTALKCAITLLCNTPAPLQSSQIAPDTFLI
uniref:Cyclin_C domain-containing protein n=1 Tax=Caenorhabditis tropicalis TaxID=1561998 RepID=A0A1I7UEI4_9PELO